MVELFLQCCERFLAADADLIRRLQDDGFELVDGGWNFTLPHLHRFLGAQAAVSEIPTYTVFRQQLFNSDINTQLTQRSAVIVIAVNTGKVDLSTYRLQPAEVMQ